MRLLNTPWLQQVRHHKLSPREEEIVHYLAKADYPKTIAQALHLSVKTVEAHCTRIKQKWRLRNKAALYQQAYLYVYTPVGEDTDQPLILLPDGTC